MKIKYFVCQSIISLFFTLSAYTLWAQIPNGYYNAIEGKKDKDLKTALYQIISNNGFKVVGYSGLWDAYKDTDARPDGKVWDMYSNTSNFTFVTDQDKGSGGIIEGDKYNREHSFPQSWFEKASGDMKSDLFNVYPTDKLVNNKRGNYPYGETNGEIYKSDNGFSKLGACSFPGYSGTVFEPNDQYKGDFARSYFYIATCYEDVFPQFGGEMTAGNSYPGYKDWVIDLLLKWHRNDNVDSKEIDRNEAVQKKQHNRNPFIDYPELVEYIWGNKKGIAFNLPTSTGKTDMNTIHIATREESIIITTSVPVHVFLYNTYGTLIQSQNGQGEIHIPANRSGIYILKIQNDKYIITRKIKL
ncbi:endonuclease [Coprobacter fastidiosus]|jgi:endonuclease I|uniref:endonuclease n=2 Tax=Coprobacter fastidiosus TaxID=1099853 RepID=UPI0022DEE703|nr:endonuclease [Coprobacter fastidiosus]